VRAGVESHGVLHPEVLREVRLELLEGGAHDVRVALEDLEDRVVELLLDAVVLADVSVEGDLDLRHGWHSSEKLISIEPEGSVIIRSSFIEASFPSTCSSGVGYTPHERFREWREGPPSQGEPVRFGGQACLDPVGN